MTFYVDWRVRRLHDGLEARIDVANDGFAVAAGWAGWPLASYATESGFWSEEEVFFGGYEDDDSAFVIYDAGDEKHREIVGGMDDDSFDQVV